VLKCLDTVVLIYLVDKASPFHQRAAEIIEQAESGLWRSCVCYQSLVEFMALVTSEEWVRYPLNPKVASSVIEKILKAPQPEILYTDMHMLRDAFSLMEKYRSQRRRFWETVIAATMLAHGVKTIITTQTRNFHAIREIHVENPFEALFV
jgi:predicted nucleic acid-binding protein